MNIHVVCTGTELLIGHTLNTDLRYLGEALNAEGYAIRQERCVPDTATEIAAAVREELRSADVVITIGGLGPTSDDLTRDAVAAELGVALRFVPEVHAAIVAYLGERSIRVPAEALRIQAMVPEGAIPLANRHGTAPGLWCPTAAGKVVVMLPGPPRELEPMFADEVLPRLKTLGPPEVLRRGFTVCGIPESVAADKVELFLAEFPGISPAYCARLSQVDIRLSAPPAARADLEEACGELRVAFGHAALPEGCATLAAAVATLLRERDWRLATAESCTGGWIAKTITDLPGASAFFCGSIVAYSNEWKTAMLDVPAETLTRHGAVSAETAAAMVTALFRRYEVEAGLAVTGVAGPSGGTPEKPVGLVYIASGLRGQVQTERFFFPGDRDSVRQRTVTLALNQLRLQLLQAK